MARFFIRISATFLVFLLLTQANYSVYATLRPLYGLFAPEFTFEATGFSDDVLQSAFARYANITFMYGPGTPFKGGPLLPGIRVEVLSSDDSLFLGINESYSIVAPDAAAGGWVSLKAATVYGALRGLETFSQLVQFNFTDKTYSIAFANVTDYPRFPFRAVMV